MVPEGDDRETLDALGAQLQAEGDRTRALIRDLKGELAAIAESTASGPDDEHDAEGSTVAYERARVQSLLALTEHTAAEIEAAAARIAGNAAGDNPALRCQRCHAPIPMERLVALPTTRICVSCAARPRA